ncbi:MAG: ABC transporter ATP-binding protein [Rhizobiaceae bacterium]
MIGFKAVSKRFDGKTAVDNVSLSVEKGEIVAIVGTSGSGKTTLLRMINRLVEPTSGQIEVDGRDVRSMPVHTLRRGIGYVIQGNGLFPHRTVAQNIATVPRLLGWGSDRIAARVDEMLALFQLDPADYRDRFPADLSGGQQQRVGVARALAAGPDLLLMDEPFAALDPIIRGKARADLKAIQRRLGTTIVLVTHDIAEAIELGDRIAVMDAGAVLQFATPEDMIVSPASDFVRAFLGTGERAFHLLSFRPVRDFVVPGEAQGEPVADTTTLRDALAEALWSAREALPVRSENGGIVGRITLDAILRQGARPR